MNYENKSWELCYRVPFSKFLHWGVRWGNGNASVFSRVGVVCMNEAIEELKGIIKDYAKMLTRESQRGLHGVPSLIDSWASRHVVIPKERIRNIDDLVDEFHKERNRLLGQDSSGSEIESQDDVSRTPRKFSAAVPEKKVKTLCDSCKGTLYPIRYACKEKLYCGKCALKIHNILWEKKVKKK